MNTFERIQELAKKRDKNLKEVSLELGFSKNYLYTLKKQEPASDKLKAIADYFNVSMDYLSGRTNNPYIGLSATQKDLTVQEAIDTAMSYSGRPLSDNDREVIKRIAEAYLESKS